MSQLAPRRVILGVSGGIAAYKAPELVRQLTKQGYEVQVVLTESALDFVSRLSLQAVSGRPVRHTLLDEAAEAGMGHIELARWADQVLIAPATANFLARLANGFADDLLTTLCLATPAPIAVAPAMNQQMWRAAATMENVMRLSERGIVILGPAAGEQACGDVGPGRMLEPEELVAHLHKPSSTLGPLRGKRVVVTAGPTREAIDPVRYISNHSSGKMGYAVAAAACRAGADVVLVSGPSQLPAPLGVRRVSVTSALDMRDAVMDHVEGCDIFIAAAAVADYRPAQVAKQKIKKAGQEQSLQMTKNPDIVAEVAARSDAPFTVGFAAETERIEEHAQEKRGRKGLQMIAANEVGLGDLGFNGDDNELVVYWEGGDRRLPRSPKTILAEKLLQVIVERFGADNPSKNS